MVEAISALVETQLSWLLSPIGLGMAFGTGFLIASGLLGRIVLVVNRELQIRSDRHHRRAADPTSGTSSRSLGPVAGRRAA